ncbi:Gfo/Idh/MocA family oxidoreductase [Amycolatopsis rubida]|uniref:Gfo/Idh/MocA family oxidoreductase n=1 Tax=Amycolatopsis rubida TaxID=112413 RepID=A0A1I6A5E9_9PSEU|nr:MULTISPECIES: Gfo/Idh/MocA family oxidoreductase [Amycolatopsis]MYW91484.1 Gfo/Idh/MocA family oxidoreductase [Amycolatopsis rubida]NEC56469.1 Gfo/Idh/MocA family oxidoreductase [Amycolatopsis rubida]OAP23488.1 putative oxidoreductase YcjS [Amycolatopsis sp. M39]SFQ63961.1 Predicted dehydrogenase [Amycolatopsis rubida]
MTVGVGVVGAGFISDAYLQNLTAFPDLRVVGVADLDLDRARGQAAKYGVSWSGSMADLLASPEVEIVVNLTVPAVHVEVSLAAVEAGKHVWTEKPIGLDRQTVRKLLGRAREKGVRVAGAPDTLLGAGHQTALRALGRIGAPVAALALFQTPGPESWHPAPEFLFQAGGGPLLDIGPYYLTQLVQVFGAVRKVTGVGGKGRETRVIGSGPRAGTEFPVTVPTTVSALIEFARGGSAQVLLTFDSALRRTGVVEVSGSLGTAVLPDPNGFGGSTVVHLAGGASPEEVTAVGHSGSRGTGVLDLARSVRGGGIERASGEMGYHVLDVMVAVEESMAGGVGVEVSSRVEPGEPLPVEWDPFVRTL